MKMLNWKRNLGTALAAGLALCAVQETLAQPGGLGGLGGFNNNANRNRNTTTGQYTPNNQVGTAQVSMDESGNLIVVGDEATIAQIQQVVQQLDRPRPQVLIKVVFLEVQHTDAMDIGIEGAYGKNLGGGVTNNLATVFGQNGLNSIVTNVFPVGPAQSFPALTQTTPGAGVYQVLGSDFQATLRAIAQAGRAQLLSRPSILARDRQPALIQIGQDVPLITSVNYTTLGNQQNGISYTSVGIILRVTPYITPNGMVQMIISPETSALNPNVSVPIAAGVNAPAIDIRRADTVAITPNGQTVVIGGLMASDKASSESKVPFLGDIPILGNLFKRKTSGGTKTELLIFLTPHIVNTPTQLASLSANEQDRSTLIQKSISEEELDKFLERVPVKKEPAFGK
jgi:Type II secretory pathway, component PulD